MNCEQARESSTALCSNELSPEEVRNLIQHTDECASCRTNLKAMQSVWIMLEHWKVASPPKHCHADFHSRLTQAQRESSSTLGFLYRFGFPQQRLSLVGTALVATLGLALIVAAPNSFRTARRAMRSGRNGIAATDSIDTHSASEVIGGSLLGQQGGTMSSVASSSNPTGSSRISMASMSQRMADTQDDSNLLPQSLRHASPLSSSAQRSIGVLVAADDMSSRSVASQADFVQTEVFRVVPVGYSSH
ncbi:MAG TPA: zf-HC2 domain-containing protein [bacterium]|nr:zf-HC2 domain-containing protein [bacterium]